MRLYRTIPAALAVAFLALLPLRARGEGSYTVRPGDTIARVASRHRVEVTALLGANRLDRTDSLRPGQELTIPDRGVVYVRAGQTLSSIARANEVAANELARANRLRPDAMLREGRRLVLPGHEAATTVEAAERRWGSPRTAGVADILRLQTEDHIRVRLVDAGGRGSARAARRLTPLFHARGTRQTARPHLRLLSVLARISDHFGGRRLEIVSGFRPAGGYTRETSRHTQGRAVDLRVRGVSTTELRDYCRTLANVGCGFYPRSRFIHVDVRDASAYWVDWSGRGERPRYGAEDAHSEMHGEAAEDAAEGVEELEAAAGEDTGGEQPDAPVEDAGDEQPSTTTSTTTTTSTSGREPATSR